MTAIDRMKNCASLLLIMWVGALAAQTAIQAPFAAGNGTTTPTYQEVMDWYRMVDQQYEEVAIEPYGYADAGIPMEAVVVSKGGVFDPEMIRMAGKSVLMVMNGIHPGESCGIDASMLWLADMLGASSLPDSMVVVIIPVYNIGGSLHRSCCSRANQVGPAEQGFRGNARNLDLNRDFAKADSRNMAAFTALYHRWKPDLFIDTHTSNGADYQHTMTLISTQKDKLHPAVANVLTQELEPYLFAAMDTSGWPMVPYVNSVGRTPETGLVGFLETPRYSTGYTALFHTIGFVTEAHMLKTYQQRVEATRSFLHHTGEWLSQHGALLRQARKQAADETSQQQSFAINWETDGSQWRYVDFKGYTAGYKTSEVSGLPRLYYDTMAPWQDTIRFYDTYRASETVQAPVAYLIPQAWQEAIALLQANGIQMKRLSDTSTVEVEIYYLRDVQTLDYPWEGHYFHTDVTTDVTRQPITFQRGDYVVYLNQPGNRYIVEMLEPRAVDSWFRWNFFDGVLMQKEYFSAYVFEDIAAAMLREQPALREALEQEKRQRPEIADNAYAQLDWMYRQSPYYEPTHLRYPIARLTENVTLPLE